MLIVKKFGGTSVGDKQRMYNVANRCIEEYKKGNYKRALELYEKAWYEFEIPEALHNLGCMYFNGEGVEKNHKKGLLQNLFPQEGETIPKYRFPEFKNDGECQ